jgi:hypothetical protein
VADEAKVGKIWQDDELDAIVSDYFDMLEADVSGQAYIKSRHSRALMDRIGRTHRSVEFKHQNISAVLDELGLPWIPGYIPKRNYQNALFDAIFRYLTRNSSMLERLSSPPPVRELAPDVFVSAPTRRAQPERMPERLAWLIKKFDPVERDHRNRSLGRAGESFVLDLEMRQLKDANRPDLARKVRWVAMEDGDGAGYDILSFDRAGGTRLIEVKTTNGSARTPFYLTRNECDVASQRPAEWQIYRVHLFARSPRVFTVAPPLEQSLVLRPETWRASF